MRRPDIFRLSLHIAFLFFCSFAGSSLYAQCTTSALNISSGYDPMTAGPVVPANTQFDPMWTSTVSPDAATAIAGNGDLVGCYDALPCPVWPAAIAGTTWMMAQNNWGQMTTGNPAHDFQVTYTRRFTVCGVDSIKLVINGMISDDWISDLFVDGTLLQAYPVMGGINFYPAASYSLGLLSGTHTISFVVHNFNNGVYLNAIGLDVDAQLVSETGAASLVSETCPNYVCDNCDEKCFWKLTGNNIIGSNNLFGTLSKDDIRIISNSVQRAVVKSSGEIGIRQLAPTTTFNVDCIPPATAPSGLRFENLPYGQGQPLVVDALGYVYVGGRKPGTSENPTELEAEIDELRREIQELKAIIGRDLGTGNTQGGTTLSISPNPSDGDMNVTYAIFGTFSKATLKITDNMGRVVMTAPIENNNGTIHLTVPATIKATTLVATVMVDGKVTASKQISYLNK